MTQAEGRAGSAGARAVLPAAAVGPAGGPVWTVLVIDDEENMRDLMSRWVRRLGHRVLVAASAEQALEVLETHEVAVAVCDVCLPGRDGLWLAAEVRTRWPDTAVVMATGLQDVGSAVAGLRRGVIDYLIKPFGRDRLREALVAAVTWHRAALATRNGRDALHGEVAERQEQLKAALAALRIESRDGLEAILGMLMIRDRALLEHSQRVARLALEIGRDLGMSGDALAALELAALVHEIGRLALPDSVAGKPGPFTANDHELVRRVPTVGHELLRAVPFLAWAAELVLARHERWDGTGYPRGLRGEAVPLGSRVLAIADTFDSMTSLIGPQPRLPEAEALEELARCRGTQFDPVLVEAARRVLGGAGGHAAALTRLPEAV